MSNMKLIMENFRDFAKEEAEQTLNEQRQEIGPEKVVINGKEYTLVGQIMAMFGATKIIDLRLKVNDTVVAAARSKEGEDVEQVKARLISQIENQTNK